MKRLLAGIFVGALVVSGCGSGTNPFGLDEERLQKGVEERALQNAKVKEGEYTEEDIELVSVCAAVKNGNSAFGHQGDYVVFWQTVDSEVQRYAHFHEDDYAVEHGADLYEEFEEIGCHNFKE
jgi:hypothetical protein